MGNEEDNEEDKRECKEVDREKDTENDTRAEEELSAAHHMQAAKDELLQHMSGLPSVLLSKWWNTNEGKRMRGQLEQTYRGMISAMTESLGRRHNSHPDVVIAPALSSSSSRTELAEGEAAAREVLISKKITRDDTFSGCASGRAAVTTALLNWPSVHVAYTTDCS